MGKAKLQRFRQSRLVVAAQENEANLVKSINERLLRTQPCQVDGELTWAASGLIQLTCGKHSLPDPKPSNCTENPWCVKGLGLEKFEKLLKKLEEVKREKMIESMRRDTQRQQCGLVNKGEQGGLNCFVQTWFNDLAFRQIIYDWRPSDANVNLEPSALYIQQLMGALQHLFFTLDTTPFSDASNEEFGAALRCDLEGMDAMTLSWKLFTTIDPLLKDHPKGESTRKAIRARFWMSRRRIDRCECGHHTDKTHSIGAITIAAPSTSLTPALSTHFADKQLEHMECAGCKRRGGIVREKHVTRLPSVLLVSLNRFSEAGRKVKTPMQYPRVLHLDPILPHKDRLNREDCRYELTAVMVHEGDSADGGHYWSVIRRPHSGIWLKYNDKSVKATAQPGVETETGEGQASHLEKCWNGLVYRRSEPANQSIPPPEEISGKWTKEMDYKFFRMSHTAEQTRALQSEEVSRRFRVVGEHMAALEVKPDQANQNVAGDVVFLPTKMMRDMLSTEYQRAVDLKEKLEGIADELDRTQVEEEGDADVSNGSCYQFMDSPQKGRNRVRRRVKAAFDDVRKEMTENAMTLSPSCIKLCPHERISYESVLGGEVKAVARVGAERLLVDYGLAVNVVTEEGVATADRLRTGVEVCTECVREKTRAVHFASGLEEDGDLATRIADEIDKRCSVRAFAHHRPPPDTFYVAKRALDSFKRDATRERQRNNQLRALSLLTWTIEPVDAARAAVGGGGVIRRQKRGLAVDREAAGAEGRGHQEEEPQLKRARLESDERRRENGGGGGRKRMEDGKEREKGPEAEVLIRNGGGPRIDEEDGPICFNEALRCTHGGFSLLESRHVVSRHEWERLNSFFQSNFEVSTTSRACPHCQEEDDIF